MSSAAAYPPPSTATSSWVAMVGGGAAAAPPSPVTAGLPGEGWPSLETVDYLVKLITLVVLLLALPWVFGKLLTEPGKVSKRAAGISVGATD